MSAVSTPAVSSGNGDQALEHGGLVGGYLDPPNRIESILETSHYACRFDFSAASQIVSEYT